MSRILLRSAKDPFQVVSPELSLALYPSGIFGRNVGNLVFGEAMHRLLSTPDVDVVSNSFLSERSGVTRRYVARINEEFDQFVIPLANAFRSSFQEHLRQLTDVIEGLSIPVVVAGVGVAGGSLGSINDPFPKIPPDMTELVRRFVKAVLDRSATIGVRGEATRDYLSSLGFGDEHVDVVGCPSLFRDGPGLCVEKNAAELTPDSAFAMNLTPYVKSMDQISVRHAERYPDMVYIPQDHTTLALMLWGTDPEVITRADLPTHTGHILYRTNRMRFFVDTATWTDFLSGQQFSFGTRIHGNIAAINARTPAHVLAHDARTLELARYHEIPHTVITDVAVDVDAADLYDQTDYTAFNAGHAARFRQFAGFLERNGLAHIFQDGMANPDYDERMARTDFPPPVETLDSRSEEARRAMIARVGALYGASGRRTLRQLHSPQLPFPLQKRNTPRIPERLRRLLNR